MDINQKLTEELDVNRWQIDAAVTLIDEGNTIPFISRYRKEATGSLNDEQLRKLHERLLYLRNLEEKKEQVISSIEEQGKMTEELKEKILLAETLVTVEDLYRPYRPKRRTRATIAKEKGLEPLAAYMMLQQAKEPLEETAKQYISEEKEVKTEEEAIAGAKDIIAEIISDNCDCTLFLSGRGKNAKEISDVLGKETIDSYNQSENRGAQTSHGLNYQKLGKELMSQDEIATMDGGKCILQVRGVRPFFSEKYDITRHPRYKYLSDADKKNYFDVDRYLTALRRKRQRVVSQEETFDLYDIDLSDEDMAAVNE